MVINEKELKLLLGVDARIEKISTISSDGRNLLTRIPKEIIGSLGITKGDKIRWMIKDDGSLCIELIK